MMKTTLAAVALLALLALACGKDDGDSATGAAARAVDTTVATAGFVTPAPVVTGSSTFPTTQAVGTRLEIESVSGPAGQKATVAITMYEATEGLAGFTLEISVADPEIARIVGVDLSDFGLSDTSLLPAAVVSLSAVDLSDVFDGPFERETIATLDLELLAPGETELVLRVLRLDDDNGDAVYAEAVHGRLLVTDQAARP